MNNGLVTVLFEKKEKSFLDRTVFKKYANRPIKIDLDKIGSFVWQLCDGKNTVQDIIAKTKVEFGDKVEPAEERVNLFINQLRRNKLITLYQKT